MSDWLIPDWPAPAGVKACVTTRAGGVSLAPFDSLNLGDHVDDSLRLWPKIAVASPIISLFNRPGCSRFTALPCLMLIQVW